MRRVQVIFIACIEEATGKQVVPPAREPERQEASPANEHSPSKDFDDLDLPWELSWGRPIRPV